MCFSASASAPTTGGNIPAAYDRFRRIGSIIRASAAIVKFLQDGDKFWRETTVADVNAAAPGTTAVSRTLSTPLGLKLIAMVQLGGVVRRHAGFHVLVSSLDVADITPSGSIFHFAFSGASTQLFTYHEVRTNTSAQVRSRCSSSTSQTLQIQTLGWIDRRGRDG